MLLSSLLPLLLIVFQLFGPSSSSSSSLYPVSSKSSSSSSSPERLSSLSSYKSVLSSPSELETISSESEPSASASSSYASPSSSTSVTHDNNQVNYLTKTNRLQKTKNVDLSSTLECHRREFTFNASRSDSLGRKCWGLVTAMSCWGRCDSSEIADYKFPYKLSWHPLCIHNRRQVRSALLLNCDRGVHHSLKVYKYVDAVSCSCQRCDSSIASCEGVDAIGRYLIRSSINEM
ncbi:uncharacterized protein LOC128395263 [Panonychus citri]|uniref:uncharacterized protein LOC128395263 n=1 Tax=Panonychus citri TaxID=50023 RepID=UPI0023076037|nr:uncharacterized protein LOC128395263 [Panonychus citri]